MTALEQINTFDLNNLPDLDTVVLAALESFTNNPHLPDTTVPFHKPLVIGSGNAAITGRIIFNKTEAVFATESDYLTTLSIHKDIDGVVLISASGGKHAVTIAKDLNARKLPVVLFTNNPTSLAADLLPEAEIRVFPKNREPYTYNTSTYLSMILADTKENPREISLIIDNDLTRLASFNFNDFRTFTFVLPSHLAELGLMLQTKFDELFGPMLHGRFFTTEEIKHAKTVIHNQSELFITVGTDTRMREENLNQLHLSLPADSNYATALAATYYLVGLIQKSFPPYFKDNIIQYCQTASQVFDQDIKPIVD